MRLELVQRQPGDAPIGALLMTPLFALPLGAWLIARGWIAVGPCSMKTLVGLPCPTCGATRATLHLLGGDLAAAFALQPLVVTCYAALAIWGTLSFIAFGTDRRIRAEGSPTARRVAALLLFALPAANWTYLVATGV